LPDDLQAQLKAVLLGNTNNEPLLRDLDSFTGDGFPVDEYAARALVERYPVEDVVTARVKAKTETSSTVSATQAENTATQVEESVETSKNITEVKENTEKQAEALQHIKTLSSALSNIGINLSAELQAAGIDPEAEGGVEAFTRFLDQNAERYLETALARSP